MGAAVLKQLFSKKLHKLSNTIAIMKDKTYTTTVIEKNDTRKQDIVTLCSTLNEFGISFIDVTKSSPKQQEVKQELIEIAKQLSKDDCLVQTIYEQKKLPINVIENKVGMSREYLEKYIIYLTTLIIIFAENFSQVIKYLH